MRSTSIRLLSFVCAGLFLVYIVVISVTVFFASWQMNLLADIEGREMEISHLEEQYYSAIETLAAASPESRGLVNPERVIYVTALGAPALSRAGE